MTPDFHKHLDYNRETGVFKWKTSRPNASPKKGPVGTLNADGYILIMFFGKRYMAHRLAWMMTYEESPKLEIDHINGVKTDNRISNLRLATTSENMQNRPKQGNNTSGYKGVCFRKRYNKYEANITKNYVNFYLGCFPTAEEAFSAYCKAAKELHGNFARIA